MNSNSLKAPIRLLNPHRPVCCESGSPAREAIALMQQQQIGCILVVSDGKLAGILSERDILCKLASQDFDPETLALEDPLAAALRLMNEGHFRHVPLVDAEKRLVGMVSIRDIFGFVAQHFLGDILNLPPRPIRRAMQAVEGA